MFVSIKAVVKEVIYSAGSEGRAKGNSPPGTACAKQGGWSQGRDAHPLALGQGDVSPSSKCVPGEVGTQYLLPSNYYFLPRRGRM